MKRASVCLLLALPAAAVARDSGPAQLDALLQGKTAAAPVDCIDPQQANGARVIDGTAIVYTLPGAIYVNRPQTGAASLRSDDVLLTRVEGGQLCRIDTIELLDPITRMPRGFVVLDRFTPYRGMR